MRSFGSAFFYWGVYMDRKSKNDSNIKSSYINDNISQNKEPDYKKLYFNLLSEFEEIKKHITSAMDKSVKDISKSYNASKASDDKLDLFKDKRWKALQTG